VNIVKGMTLRVSSREIKDRLSDRQRMNSSDLTDDLVDLIDTG